MMGRERRDKTSTAKKKKTVEEEEEVSHGPTSVFYLFKEGQEKQR